MNNFITIQISRNVYMEIYDTFLKYNTEMCGILGSTNGNYISNWFFICNKNISPTGVVVKKHIVEKIVNKKWYKQGIHFVGLVHNHINAPAYLSSKDIYAASEILRRNPYLPFIYMLIFHKDRNDKLYGYKLSFGKTDNILSFSEIIWEII